MSGVICTVLTNYYLRSMWLRKTQNGTTRMSRWVWIIGMTLLIVRTCELG